MLDLNQLEPWKLQESRKGPEVPLFEIEIKKYRNPRNNMSLEAIVLHAHPTVNIICINKEDEVLLVEQFRFGSNQFHLELPAGLVDAGENRLKAAQRELLEETGYASSSWKALGVSYINPAYVDNTCEHFLASNAEHVQEVSLDFSEDIAIHKVPLVELPKLIKGGVVCDSVSRAAFTMFSIEEYRRMSL